MLHLVIPVKRFALAKTRLGAVPDRAALALALAGDTVEAVLACPEVTSVLVVTDEPAAARLAVDLGARVSPDDPDAGLNAALSHGAAVVRPDRRTGWVGTVSADLPALRPADLSSALAEAAGSAAYVPDRAGDGTTVLLAPPGQRLHPLFGPESARRHQAAGMLPVGAGLLSLRCDIDTREDLAVAQGLGLGPRTAALLRQWAEAV